LCSSMVYFMNGDTLGAVMYSTVFDDDPMEYVVAATLNVRAYLDEVMALSPYAVVVRT
jgi:hypothetical protein